MLARRTQLFRAEIQQRPSTKHEDVCDTLCTHASATHESYALLMCVKRPPSGYRREEIPYDITKRCHAQDSSIYTMYTKNYA
eukprot:m.1549535 g.1549535  ORF g.1549535 m.1549535 type:complete len:82 (+) comp25265_c0_seq15:3088-3333(+)